MRCFCDMLKTGNPVHVLGMKHGRQSYEKILVTM
jgi:hypothetical protein